MICADCDYFALEPGKRRTGACLARWMPGVQYDGVRAYGAYGRVFPFERACTFFVDKGKLERLEPVRIDYGGSGHGPSEQA